MTICISYTTTTTAADLQIKDHGWRKTREAGGFCFSSEIWKRKWGHNNNYIVLHTLGQKIFLKRQFSNGNCTIQVLLILQSCELIIVYCTIFQFLNHCVMPDGWESSEWFNHHHTLCMVSKGGYSKFYLDGCKSEGCIYAIMGPLDTKSEIGAISSVYNSQNSKSSHSAMPINML